MVAGWRIAQAFPLGVLRGEEARRERTRPWRKPITTDCRTAAPWATMRTAMPHAGLLNLATGAYEAALAAAGIEDDRRFATLASLSRLDYFCWVAAFSCPR